MSIDDITAIGAMVIQCHLIATIFPEINFFDVCVCVRVQMVEEIVGIECLGKNIGNTIFFGVMDGYGIGVGCYNTGGV